MKIFTLIILASLSAPTFAAPSYQVIDKKSDVAITVSAGKKTQFGMIKSARLQLNQDPVPPAPIKPIRTGRLKSSIIRTWADTSGPTPIWKNEVLCRVDASLPVYHIEPNTNPTVEIDGNVCPTTLNGRKGQLVISALVILTSNPEQQKIFSSWMYFVPDETSPSDPNLLPGDAAYATTKTLNLEDLSFGLGLGYQECVQANPDPKVARHDDVIGTPNPCQPGEFISSDAQLIDSAQ